MAKDQNHGKLTTQNRTARIGDVATEIEKGLGDLRDDSGTVAAHDG